MVCKSKEMAFTAWVFFLVFGIIVCEAWKQPLKKGIASVGVGLGLLIGATPSFADAVPAVGTKAPDFSLPSNTGSNIGLKDLGSKYSVIYFYPGDFTSGCTIEAKAFERDYTQYKDLETQILGISVDSIDKHLDFSKKYGLEFPLASDEGGKVSNKYGSLLDIPFMGKFSNRQTYIVDNTDGVIKYVFTDVESKLASHSSDVLNVLKKLKESG